MKNFVESFGFLPDIIMLVIKSIELEKSMEKRISSTIYYTLERLAINNKLLRH
jgi:hypothetical protein